jgi:hypothetical protein
VSHDHDILPRSPGVSAMVRRIVFRLNADLAFNSHPILTSREHNAFFYLDEASEILDRIAVLPRMERHEERARRDLLELYDVFNPLDPLEQTIEMPTPLVRMGIQILTGWNLPKDGDK